jgi:hypothetical protein
MMRRLLPLGVVVLWSSVVSAQAPNLQQILIDSPKSGAVGQVFEVSGFAYDARREGLHLPGVDAIHVWAFAVDGSLPPQFMGAITGPFTGSWSGVGMGGFRAQLRTNLKGVFHLVFWAHSSLTLQFDNAAVVTSVQITPCDWQFETYTGWTPEGPTRFGLPVCKPQAPDEPLSVAVTCPADPHPACKVLPAGTYNRGWLDSLGFR